VEILTLEVAINRYSFAHNPYIMGGVSSDISRVSSL
jgi:hypothetical protein